MQALKDFIKNIEIYGNCEFYTRDYYDDNAALKYVFLINDKKVIKVKKYWCIYQESLENSDFLDSRLVYQEYINDNISECLTEIIISSISGNAFCTHNLCLDNENQYLISNFIILTLKYILSDLKFFDYYFLGDLKGLMEHMKDKFKKIFFENALAIDSNPLSIEEIIDVFGSYTQLNQKEYKRIKRAKTVEEYDKALGIIKIK